VLVVVGPTGSGKSTLAVDLALALRGEVVNADSMALYRGMDIGTATPTAAERRGVPHHLFGVLDPREDASVAAYQTRARAAVEGLRAAGTATVVVGGSGLHLRALLDDLDFPGTDPALRAALEAEAAELGTGALHARLAALSPETAARVPPGNARRVVRALEVLALTGRPPTAVLPDPGPARWGAVQVGLDPPLDVLDARISARTDGLYDAGLVEEVRALDAAGLGRTAARAIGYASVLRLLAGEVTAAQAREETARATRRLVRRQRSWWRRDTRIRWLPWSALSAAYDGEPEALVRVALAHLAGAGPAG